MKKCIFCFFTLLTLAIQSYAGEKSVPTKAGSTVPQYFFYKYDPIPNPFTEYSMEGIPLTERKKEGNVIHPVAIAQQLLVYYGKGFKGRGEDKKQFKKIISSIIQSDELNGANGVLMYNFPFQAGTYKHKFETGWSSAMAQGQMLSVVARAYREFPDIRKELANYGERLMVPLTLSEANGGHLYKISANGRKYDFYEEYPTPGAPPLTLNGFMFALIGLYEYEKTTGSAKARVLFDKGMRTLKLILPAYNTKPLSTYDLSHVTKMSRPNISYFYHKVHIEQLDFFIGITNDKDFSCVKNALIEHQKMFDSSIPAGVENLSNAQINKLIKALPLSQDESCKLEVPKLHF